ncbi:MAG: TonB-dependent receptor [Acidobacteria bacterium]|nr:TonB-dependent receptor [Acidobacteriota bacterium]
MRSMASMTASAAIVGLVLLCRPAVAAGQAPSQTQPVMRMASLAPGSIQGQVRDEQGLPIAGAMVSALGAMRAFAVTDRSGRFELRTLSPGSYLVRAHSTGFVASRGQLVDVRPSARVSSSIALRRAIGAGAPLYPVATAGLGAAPAAGAQPTDAPAGADAAGADDHGEIAWRLRHARRGILKDVTIPAELLAADTPPSATGLAPANALARVVESPARITTNFFESTPFSGQVNLLTTGSFDAPQQLFTAENFSHSIAYLALGAPVGEHADWTVRAALTQGDIASWIVAGEYTTRAPARHIYDLGWSYSAQRYDGGSFSTMTQGVADGSRTAGALYGFDTFAMTPAITLTYGGSYARYDYLDGQSLLSPRVSLTIEPVNHFRVSGIFSRRAVAPGAEEFMPRLDRGIWLPPQRTFSSLAPGQPLAAEHSNHVELEVERDVASTTVSLRAFRQHVADQLVTLFGLDLPGAPTLGNYLLGNAGDVNASGLSAGLRAAVAGRVRGSVAYSLTRAHVNSTDGLAYMLLYAPSAIRLEPERIHDVATTIETDVPETSTHVVVLYRISNAFANPVTNASTARVGQTTGDRPALDSRFDVQVRQSLPFMGFSSAKWEMLVAVRNFFRETSFDQSVYDELLVVRPPKRIVGGLTLKF